MKGGYGHSSVYDPDTRLIYVHGGKEKKQHLSLVELSLVYPNNIMGHFTLAQLRAQLANMRLSWARAKPSM